MGLIDRDALTASTPRELLATYESILVELRSRGIVRTNDAPLGQWAEWLARRVLGGTLERNSRKGHDLITADRRRVQVKARLVRDVKRKSERQLSVFRSFKFHACLVLLFDPKYEVRSATLLSPKAVRTNSRFHKHVNGWVLSATEDLLQRGTDLTKRFR